MILLSATFYRESGYPTKNLDPFHVKKKYFFPPPYYDVQSPPPRLTNTHGYISFFRLTSQLLDWQIFYLVVVSADLDVTDVIGPRDSHV